MGWSPFYVQLSEGIAIKLSPPGTTYHTIFRMFITLPENLQSNACPKKDVTESSLQNSLIQKQPSVCSLVRKKANGCSFQKLQKLFQSSTLASQYFD